MLGKEGDAPTSLPGEINASTRSLHTALNRLVTSRLPLALPPHASDPTLYTTGLLHFSHIFLTFESLWSDLISVPHPPTNTNPDADSTPASPLLSFLLVNPYDAPSLFSKPPSPQLLHFLQTLRPKGLSRSGRLKRDLEYLTGLHPTDLDVLLASYPGDSVAQFCKHVRRAVQGRPHVLVAYAWCFYMAVFSGGRWIRGELVKAGDAFWSASTVDGSANSNMPYDGGNNVAEDAGTGVDASQQGEDCCSLHDRGLSFWNFPGAHDGADIKAEFKKRLAAAEDLFTDDERIDILQEAQTIFKFCAALVRELDEKLGTDEEMIRGRDRYPHELDINKEETEATSVLKPGGLHKNKEMRSGGYKPVTWLKRPEVSGMVVALGCLACYGVLVRIGGLGF